MEKTLKVFGKWTVYMDGISNNEREYWIDANRLAEDDWILHLSEKGWIDWNDFIPAYLYACKHFGIKKVEMTMAYN